MKHGFITGALSSIGNNYISGKTHVYALRVTASAVLGGTVEEVGGGKFANGAITGAYSMLFNDMMHPVFTDRQLKKIYDVYRKDFLDFKTPADFYNHIGGPLGEWAEDSPEFGNTCAARLSRALN